MKSIEFVFVKVTPLTMIIIQIQDSKGVPKGKDSEEIF